MVRTARLVLLLAIGLLQTTLALAQAPVSYRLSFADRVHRLMDVEVTFAELPAAPLQLRMSRTSPGRYAIHEFAKNVFGVEITDESGRPLTVSRPNPHQWDVAQHGATVKVRYRIYGDRADGTYLGVDTTHAHINMPASLMWARGLEARPVTVRFEPPAGENWRVATQLFPGADAFTFTAPNLQYLMDSPSEFSAHAVRTFTVPDGTRTPTFRIALHHAGTDNEFAAFAGDVEKVVREMRAVFGEFPAFDTGTYTFIADYLPWVNGDGMEHRNSTSLTSTGSLRDDRADLLGTVSHEFFHAWNVERIRPRTLEPFNFEEANMTGELWFAEGVTNYYGPLVLQRASLTTVREFAAGIGAALNTVVNAPGRQVRTAEEMSRHAPFTDAAAAIDRTNFDNTFISYYTWGSAIGLGLDLSLRVKSDNRVTLDHVMHSLWETHGKPGGRPVGYVDKPYTLDDVKAAVTSVSGDAAFTEDFFRRYVQGHDVIDYEPLLARAGLVLRRTSPTSAWVGSVRLQDAGSAVRIVAAAPFGSPIYAAGLDRDDLIRSLGGRPTTSTSEFTRAVEAQKPGAGVTVEYERRGIRATTTVTVIADPRLALVPIEETGGTLTPAQRSFRDAWLSSQQARTF